MPPRRRRTAPGAETPESNVERAQRAERTVRVRFVQSVSATEASHAAGDVLEVDRASADVLVAAGWARVEDE